MGDSFFKLTVLQAQEGLKEKKFSSADLVKSCLQRIKKNDEKIKAFVTLGDDCLDEAKKADKEIAEDPGAFCHKPLLGIPVAIKDNFLTQGVKTTASSLVLEDYYPVYDATVVNLLKKAGAIIIGKTNMDAWAHGSSTETSQFFTTRNPWDTTRLPGGSSGGSAAAVAKDMILGAVGSETAGSIRQPASWCGVTGLKPSYGVVSRYGLIAMTSSTDCPGPLTKDVDDAELFFKVLAQKDELDATSVETPFDKNKGKDLNKIVLGVPKEYLFNQMEEGVKNLFSQAVELFGKNKIECREISLLDPSYSIADYTIIQRAEVSSNLARFDGIRYGKDRSFFGDEAKRRIMLGTHVLSSGYYDAYYLKGQKVRTLICRDFERAFSEVDLIISPTTPCTALPIGSSKDAAMFGELQDVLAEPSSLAGLPALSIPCGFDEKKLPVGLQIIGPRFSEFLILKVGRYYQSLTNWHTQKPDEKN